MVVLGSSRLPILFCLIAAALWGLWWIPIYWLEHLGLHGGYAALAMNLGALPVLYLASWRDPSPIGRRAMMGALAIGLAVTLYGVALTKTDVVRAVLLFYFAPAWSILIECLFFGRRWQWQALLALGCAFAGVVAIFGGAIDFGNWRSGDLMALVSGLAWAVGAALVFADSTRNPVRLALWTFAAASVVGVALAPLTAEFPDMSAIRAAALPATLSGALYLAPIVVVTLWGAFHLPPATISFLLTAEIVVGVASSAYWLNQPFGLTELAGAVLIVSAALIEIAGQRATVAKCKIGVE